MPDTFSVRAMCRDQMQEVLDHALQIGMPLSISRVQDLNRAQTNLKVRFSDEKGHEKSSFCALNVWRTLLDGIRVRC